MKKRRITKRLKIFITVHAALLFINILAIIIFRDYIGVHPFGLTLSLVFMMVPAVFIPSWNKYRDKGFAFFFVSKYENVEEKMAETKPVNDPILQVQISWMMFIMTLPVPLLIPFIFFGGLLNDLAVIILPTFVGILPYIFFGIVHSVETRKERKAIDEEYEEDVNERLQDKFRDRYM